MPWDSEIADVEDDDTITTLWGNSIRDRVVHGPMTFASLPATADAGALAVTTDEGVAFFDGSDWNPIEPTSFGYDDWLRGSTADPSSAGIGYTGQVILARNRCEFWLRANIIAASGGAGSGIVTIDLPVPSTKLSTSATAYAGQVIGGWGHRNADGSNQDGLLALRDTTHAQLPLAYGAEVFETGDQVGVFGSYPL